MDIASLSLNGIIENLYDGLYFVDTNRQITFWNRGAERISGFTAAEVVGRSCADNILTHVDGEGRSLCGRMCPLAATIGDSIDREAEVFMHHRNGHRIPVLVRTSPLRNREGTIVGGIELFTDLSAILANNYRVRELEKLALLDPLTQLANRNYLHREIDARFSELQRLNVPFGLIFIDIDHFKRFNDTYGHDVGDLVLQFVAKVFVANSRPFDLFGRWGGEEFIGVIRNITVTDLAALGNRIRMLVEKSYILAGEFRLGVTISLGATMAGPDDTLDNLIKRADNLLYESKQQGRNRLTLG